MTPDSVLSAEQSKKRQRNQLLRQRNPQRSLDKQLSAQNKPASQTALRKSILQQQKQPEKLFFPLGRAQGNSSILISSKLRLQANIKQLLHTNSLLRRHGSNLNVKTTSNLLNRATSRLPHRRKRREVFSAGF
jgi:hypothetical protein